VAVLLAAAVFGQVNHQQSGYENFLPGLTPEAASYSSLKTSGKTTLYQAVDTTGEAVGFITAAEGPGYGGPMSVLVGWTTDGVITSVIVPEHHEDLPWWKVLAKNDFFNQYVGRSYSEPLQLFADIDANTGSTVSSNGVAVGGAQRQANFGGIPGPSLHWSIGPYPYWVP